MTDAATTKTATLSTTGTSITSVLSTILTGIGTDAMSVVLSIVTIFMPQFLQIDLKALGVIANNFRLFLQAVATGAPWGQALADMETADWNEVDADAQQVGIDFAAAVATALEKMGVIPSTE